MTLHEEQERVQKAVHNSLSHVQEDPWLAQRVIAKAKGEKPVGKKISVLMILAIVLIILSMTAALAAGLRLFGEMAQRQDADSRLPVLEEASESVSASLTTENGITIEISQAYYEGNRVFMSYRMSGNHASVELHEGAPEGEYPWQLELENTVAAETFRDDVPELQRLNVWLDGKSQRWGISSYATIHDGLFLEDGTYLDIVGGDNYVQEDGSITGWKECKIPKDRQADTLTFKLVLFRSRNIIFQDGATYKSFYERLGNTDVFFTLNRNDHYEYLKGSSRQDRYQASAEFALGKVDLKGTVHVTAPEAWVKAWTDCETKENLDMIIDWSLYQNGKRIGAAGVQSIRGEGTRDIYFELLYPRTDSANGLSLVPEYSQSGEHADEAIIIQRIIE
ncbi:MAG: DUF4179 domain-containing protein [Clostridia bacterium]|nr:DUF4179 domain-containing protein [Clostridia bacterium]